LEFASSLGDRQQQLGFVVRNRDLLDHTQHQVKAILLEQSGGATL
jgi:hypothetical protein